MGMISFANVSSNTALPEGDYTLSVDKIEFNNEKNYYNWQFSVVACNVPEYEGKFVGRKLWSITSLKENALWKLKEYLLALGETEETLKGDFDFDPENYINAEVAADVTQREYNNKVQNDVTLLTTEAVTGMSLFK